MNLAGRGPFHRVFGCTPAPTILRSERPEKPSDVQPLGFPGTFWGSTSSCWSESRSNRQTARRLLGCLSTAWNVNMDMAESTNLVHKTRAKTEGKGVAKRILPTNPVTGQNDFLIIHTRRRVQHTLANKHRTEHPKHRSLEHNTGHIKHVDYHQTLS